MIDPSLDLVYDDYVTDVATGKGWTLHLGDSCEVLAKIDTDSVDLSVYSPPFDSLFVYSPSPRDLGNSSNRREFLEHYDFVIREVLRVTKPGRLSCVHVQQLSTTKATHGVIGLTDFRGQIIQAHVDAGWIFHGEATINKNPQAQAIRTKAQALMFVTKNKDSAKIRPALADYLLIFRKPGDNAVPVDTDVSNDEWIDWAQPVWLDPADHAAAHEGVDGEHLCPVWLDIKETDTLNARVARESEDERHICPLQIPFIERCLRLYSNPGELVLSPFAGIGSEVYTAVRLGRQGVGIELKASYWKTAVDNVRSVEREVVAPTLFEELL